MPSEGERRRRKLKRQRRRRKYGQLTTAGRLQIVRYLMDRDGPICQLGGELLLAGDVTLDRIDSGLGYVLPNLQLACGHHNSAKGQLLLPPFAYSYQLHDFLLDILRSRP